MFIFFLTLVSVIPFANSYVNSKVIDEIVSLLSVNKDVRIYDSLLTFVVLYIIFFVSNQIFWVIVSLLEKIQYFAITRYFVSRFLEKSSSLDLYHYENPKSNDIVQKAKDIYEWRPRDMANRFGWMIGNLVTIVASMIIVLNFSFWAFLLVFITTLPNLFINFKLGKSSWGIWEANATDRRRYWWTADLLAKEYSLMELRIFRTKDYLLDIIKNIFDTFTNKEKKNQYRRSIIESFSSNISSIGIIAFFLISIKATLDGEITIGLLTFYFSAVRSFSDSLSGFFNQISKQYEDSLYIVDFFNFIDLENTMKSGAVKLDGNKKPPFISFKNVDFKYPNTEKYVLKNFNLDIEPGEKIAFVGENGAGKTTIVKLLCRFYNVTDGEILVDGVNVNELDFDSLYKKFGVLFQEFVKYQQFSARTNIELGDFESIGDQRKLEDSIFKSDAKNFIESYEKGLDQILSKSFEGGINPSTGQWQRIALARAFFRDAPVLILDEPTSAIDAKAEYAIFERLFKFSENKSVIIISHRFSTVRKANKIYVIDDGQIVEQGTHDELLALDGKYAKAFNLQAEGYK